MRANEFITERKKKRKKYRGAAFGWYGADAGYSGDGGGVGEASYSGNIGAMEVFKFMSLASDIEKKLLKKLLAQKAYSKAWALVQNVTGTKLQGKEFEIEEGWKDWIAGGAMALGALGANAGEIVSQIADPGDTVYSIARDNGVHPSVIMKLNGFNKDTKLKVGQEVKIPDNYKEVEPKKSDSKKPEVKKTEPVPTSANSHEKLLIKVATAAGIEGTELAAFLAQVAHESHDFQSMVEYGGSLDFRKYDIRYNPKKAKILGNTKPGDGARYKGRGYIQITGKYNYAKAGKALGIDLVKNPKLAENPDVAAKIAVWFWQHRVQPNVDNFDNVKEVTKPINPGLRGLEDRKENFDDYKILVASL